MEGMLFLLQSNHVSKFFCSCGQDARPSEAEAPDARSMIRDINKHAAVVLEGVPTPDLGPDDGPAERPPTSGALPC